MGILEQIGVSAIVFLPLILMFSLVMPVILSASASVFALCGRRRSLCF